MLRYKKMVSLLVIISLVLSAFSIAQDVGEDPEEVAAGEDYCAGFWGRIKCFFWGDPENRAGMGWFDRKEALVGKLAELPAQLKLQEEPEVEKPNWKKLSETDKNKWATAAGIKDHTKGNQDVLKSYYQFFTDNPEEAKPYIEEGIAPGPAAVFNIVGYKAEEAKKLIGSFQGDVKKAAAEAKKKPKKKLPEKKPEVKKAPSTKKAKPTVPAVTPEQKKAVTEVTESALRTNAMVSLGDELYEKYEGQIDWEKGKFEGPGAILSLPFKEGNSDLKIKAENNLVTATFNIKSPDAKGKVVLNKDQSQKVLLFNGQVVASQSVAGKEKGTMTIDGKSVYLGEKNKDAVKELKEKGELTYFESEEEAEELGKLEFDKEKNIAVNTNYDDESQSVINLNTKEKISWEGDWDVDEKKFTPEGGFHYNNKGKVDYLLDPDYKEGQLKEVELIDLNTGLHEGTIVKNFGDYEDVTVLRKGKDKTVIEYKGEKKEFSEDEQGQLVDSKGKNVATFLYYQDNPVQLSAEERKAVDAYKKATSSAYKKKTETSSLVKTAETTHSTANKNFEKANKALGDNKLSEESLNSLKSFVEKGGTKDRYLQLMVSVPSDKKTKLGELFDAYAAVHIAETILTAFKFNKKQAFADATLLSGEWDTTDPAKQQVIIEAMDLDYSKYVAKHGLVSFGKVGEEDVFIDPYGFVLNADGDFAKISDKDYNKLFPQFQAKQQEAKQKMAAALKEEKKKIDAAKAKEEKSKKGIKDGGENELAKDARPSEAARVTQEVIESVYAVSTVLSKDYSALSQLFWGDSNWYKGWKSTADSTFAPMLGSNWFPSAICEGHYDIEPEGKAMIKTVSETYQAVASVQGERSGKKSPILCERNPDPEAEQEWLCSKRQVCIDNSFCYKDENQDGQPDEETPLEGYFYKITWAVSSPSDEAFTPFIDENGVAVSFNVWVKNNKGSIPLYRHNGDIRGPIELRNGESDRDVIIQYSPAIYNEVCIEWDQAPVTTYGRFSGTESIGNVCFDLVKSTVGQVNWKKSGSPASTKASEGEVSRTTDW